LFLAQPVQPLLGGLEISLLCGLKRFSARRSLTIQATVFIAPLLVASGMRTR
jgi:hypothetical protein